MFILIAVAFSLWEIKSLFKERKINLLIFYGGIIILSFFLYIFRHYMPSLNTIIEVIKKWL